MLKIKESVNLKELKSLLETKEKLYKALMKANLVNKGRHK